MKATELRIGNIATQDGELILGVTSNTIHKFALGQIALEGVHLTEEWLERFGFETECKWIYDCRAVKGDFYITLDHDGATVIGYPTSVGMRNKWMFVQDIEYVHQLQNLYFALTGKELNSAE